MTLSLEACQALKALGYPQDKADFWRWPRKESGERDEFVAAPDPLTALTWLESALSLRWGRQHSFAAGSVMYSCPTVPGTGFGAVEADDPSGLIVAIAAAIAARKEVQA